MPAVVASPRGSNRREKGSHRGMFRSDSGSLWGAYPEYFCGCRAAQVPVRLFWRVGASDTPSRSLPERGRLIAPPICSHFVHIRSQNARALPAGRSGTASLSARRPSELDYLCLVHRLDMPPRMKRPRWVERAVYARAPGIRRATFVQWPRAVDARCRSFADPAERARHHQRARIGRVKRWCR